MTDAGVPYLGSRISLISKAEIRYEGTLYNITMEESSIALQNVRSFGTEGRRRDGPQAPPQNEIYEIIIFKAEDIADLTVLSQAPTTPAPPQQQPYSDPAIISATAQQYNYGAPPPPPSAPKAPADPWATPAPSAPTGQPYNTALYGSSQWAPSAPPAAPAPYQQKPSAPAAPLRAPTQATVAPTMSISPQQQQQPPPKPSTWAQAAGARPGAPGRGTGYQNNNVSRGGAVGGRGGRMPGRGPNNSGVPQGPPGQPRLPATGGPPPMPVPKEDFDFTAALEKFNKEEISREVENGKDQVYQKDDFFDCLSCEALERSNAGGDQRNDWRQKLSEQKRLDMETFGGLGGVRHHSYGRGRGGGRGMGRGGMPGRGRGEGRGRYTGGRGMSAGRGGRGGRGAVPTAAY